MPRKTLLDGCAATFDSNALHLSPQNKMIDTTTAFRELHQRYLNIYFAQTSKMPLPNFLIGDSFMHRRSRHDKGQTSAPKLT